MKLENGHISEHSLMFGVYCFMQASMLRTAFIVGVTKNDSWAMAFTGLALALVLVAIYTALLRRYQQKNLFEINELIFGNVLGKVFSAFYLFFFLTIAALNARDLGNFAESSVLPGTPLTAFILMFLMVCVYAIRKGIENMMRLATVLSFVAAGALVFNVILILKNVNIEFLKPMFQLPFKNYVQGSVTVAAVPMGEIVAFTMITPMLGKNMKAGKMMALGLTFSAVSLAVIILRDIVTLGPLIEIVRLPSFESVRYISLAGVMTRMESIFAVILISLFLFKTVILLYASVVGLAQILNFKSYSPLTLICGALVLFYSLIVTKSAMENEDWGASVAPFFSLSFELLLPAIALATMMIKGMLKKKEAQQ